ncbi:hypothetical protein ACFQS7_15885 [Dankookia sp. GCM10030260]|uniref:hypothetical protein n=1 Tax=Dankookia sp. GCM10030260 TaxID=3273390 RepID=UPI00360E350C
MFRSILLASTFAVALAGAAHAQGGPRMVGGGPDAQVVYDAPSDNVVGGGLARIIGGANDQRLAYGGTPATLPPTGLIAEITGEAGNREIAYRTPSEARGSGMLAGRPARVGG